MIAKGWGGDAVVGRAGGRRDGAEEGLIAGQKVFGIGGTWEVSKQFKTSIDKVRVRAVFRPLFARHGPCKSHCPVAQWQSR